MKAYCITLPTEYSEAGFRRCRDSGAAVGMKVDRWEAVTQDLGQKVMRGYGLEWTWPTVEPDQCPFTGLKRHPYRTKNLGARIGCAMSHYQLWMKCIELNEPILILEHDAIFERMLLIDAPSHFNAIMLNNPEGATPKGRWWRERIEAKGHGVHEKTIVFEDGRPDGLAGNSAYVISPHGAHVCVYAYERYGVWPNDATLCRQIVPKLYEVYPFVTRVKQTQSTSGGY